MKMSAIALALALGPPVVGAQRLSALEERLGWSAPFDGDPVAWHLAGDPASHDGWTIEDGVLELVRPGAGDLVSRQVAADLELEFEWRVAPGANSGVKVRLNDDRLGLEYQVLDDAAHPDTLPRHTAGALYDLAAPDPEAKRLEPAGSWNRARLVASGPRLEHWLNGARVVALDQDGDAWAQRVARSKFADVDGFGRGAGRILFQDHGGRVAFRRVRLRAWSHPGERLAPADGAFDGWKELGDAVWSVADDVILGEVGGGAQSFLATERTFSDFVLEVDVRTWARGNSGIQIRSHETDDGRLRGYQIEIDPSDRAWSGGLYDEYRRGWLDDSQDNAAARAAFRVYEWNRYRIECMGPWIRTWIDGVPVADRFDVTDLEGVIGLQVHSGSDTRVEWRDPRILDLGRHVWRPLGPDSPLGHFELDADASQGDLTVADDGIELRGRVVARSSADLDDFTIRMLVAGPGGRLTLRHGDVRFEHRPGAEPQELALCRYADRTVFLVGGQVTSDVRGATSRPAPLELFVRAGSQPLRLARVEALMPADDGIRGR